MTIFRTIRNLRFLSLLKLALILHGCSGLEQSEYEKIRRKNCKGEYIYRRHGESLFVVTEPEHLPRSNYPWETDLRFPKITKEFFRCKGSHLNPPIVDKSQKNAYRYDCKSHGLPLIDNQENVYPILIELLNYVQKKTNRRVVITSGHCCPEHNTYSNPSKNAQTSKHLIGAEVDFYVQGLEHDPLQIINLILEYYRVTPRYCDLRDYQLFTRYNRDDTDVLTKPWYNKEIFIKLYNKNEGRDFDNRHPYPYISIQVRYDRKKEQRVTYTWEQAHINFLRW